MSRKTLPTHAEWKRIEEIFHDAVELSSDARSKFLGKACGSDAALRREVECLLTADGESTDDGCEPATVGLDSLRAGQQIGTYKLMRELGEGGMGSVWLAERIGDDFRKTVAIKVVKRGVDTDEVLRRFRRERQVLARMQHPYIATLLDGGATEDGRPNLVMEHIDGTRITDYCEDKIPVHPRFPGKASRILRKK